MRRYPSPISVFVLGAIALLACVLPMSAAPAATPHRGVSESYGKLPLTFEKNEGQTDKAVKFLSRGHGYSLFFTPSEAVLHLQGPQSASSVVRWQLVGGNHNPRVTGEDALPSRSNYFRGNDPAKWHTGVANYAKVRYQSVYPGVDVVYYGNQRQLEYDFVVAPGASPRRIRLGFEGVDSMTINANGDLVLQTATGDLVQHRPAVYQDMNGVRRQIDGHYKLLAAHNAGFEIGPYDHSRPLIIDPTLLYSTYLGGTDFDGGGPIAVDSSGNAYVGGLVISTTFPGVTGSSAQPTQGGDFDGFITKIAPSGTSIVWSTFLGGTGTDYVQGLAVDGSGNVYVTGGTNGSSFPGVTGSSIQPSYGGGLRDAFVTKINSTGTAIVYSTFLGGAGDDLGDSIAVDSSGNAYVAGDTASSSFPGVTGSSIESTNPGGAGFVTKINAAGTAITYSTFLAGNVGAGISWIAVDSSGNAFVTGGTNSTSFLGVTGSSAQSSFAGGGSDAFVTKINAAGTAVAWSTYLGGGADDTGTGIALDGSGNVYVAGITNSTTFPGVTGSSIQPTNAGNQDLFVTALNSTGTSINWSTFLGGSDLDAFSFGCLAADSSGNVYVGGGTLSTSFTGVTGSSLQPSNAGGAEGFVTKINSGGASIGYSTFLGDTGDDEVVGVAVDSSGNAYVTGRTSSTSFPGVNGASPQPTYGGGDGDVFVTKIGDPGTPNILSISPATGRAGDQITIVGSSFGNPQGSGSVWLGSTYGTVVSWSNTQVVATIASGSSSGVAQIYAGGVWSNAISLTVITPNITSISPTTGYSGDQITITGTGFGSSQGSGNVWLGSTYGTVVSWSDTQVVATIVSGATSGVAQILQGGVWSNAISLTVITPNITSISPNNGVAGTSVTFTGTGFRSSQGSGAVWLGSTYGTVTSWSDTQIVATVATGSTSGVAQVLQGGVWSNAITFTVNTPHITSISPTSGVAGTQITINGTGFAASQGSGNVWLGSTYGTVVSWSDTQVVATIASGATSGVAQVLQGGVWSNAISLTVITPHITSISPTHGSSGTQITFTGTGFQSSQGSGAVWLGSTYGTIVSWSDTQIVASVASGASSGVAQVLQGGVWSNSISFSVP
jgi:hypothetical protein